MKDVEKFEALIELKSRLECIATLLDSADNLGEVTVGDAFKDGKEAYWYPSDCLGNGLRIAKNTIQSSIETLEREIDKC
jgi:hypothetical protein